MGFACIDVCTVTIFLWAIAVLVILLPDLGGHLLHIIDQCSARQDVMVQCMRQGDGSEHCQMPGQVKYRLQRH